MSTMLVLSLMVFCCTTLLAVAAFQTVARRDRLQRRYRSLSPVEAGETSPGRQDGWSIDPARLGLNADAQRALRGELIRAGFFDASAVPIFALARLGLALGLPLAGTALAPLVGGNWGPVERVALACVLLLIGFILPRAFLSRRRTMLEGKYRLVFPDFLDMLVVCINAGLSLEAALDRAAGELDEADAEFRANLDLMASEMRAGKSTPDALKTLADRLSLREARSFAGLLQQTIELGTDVAQALTIFSDEMRDRRMSRAEERAAALPPKLTLPLGLFIFPVVLIAILAPAVLKVMSAVAR